MKNALLLCDWGNTQEEEEVVVGRRLSAAAAAAALVCSFSERERWGDSKRCRRCRRCLWRGTFVVDTREEDTFEKEENFVDFIMW